MSSYSHVDSYALLYDCITSPMSNLQQHRVAIKEQRFYFPVVDSSKG